jgi:hypothetical protein
LRVRVSPPELRQARNRGGNGKNRDVQLELDEAQASVLREVVDAAVRDLSHEIADTDTPSFRAGLKERRDRLREILAGLGGPIPNTERFADRSASND